MSSFFAAPLSHRLSPIVIALFLVIFGSGLFSTLFQPTQLQYKLTDPDSILRLVMVEKLIKTGDWYDHLVDRTNPPTGTITPWTRPSDIVLLVGYAPLRLFMPEKQALIGSSMIMPPLLFALGLFVMWRWMTRHAFSFDQQLFLLLALALYPIVKNVFKIGGADHHGLLLICSWMQLIWTYSLIQGKTSYALPLGLITGLGIWISPEFFIVTTLCFSFLGLCWLRQPQTYYRPLLTLLSATTAVVFLAIVTEQRNPITPFYDTVSIVYGALLLGLTIGLIALRPTHSWTIFDRSLGALGVLLIIVAGMLHLYPEFYKLTQGGLDPYITQSFLPIVSEQKPTIDSFDSLFSNRIWAWSGLALFNIFFLMGYVFFFRTLRKNPQSLLHVTNPAPFILIYASIMLILGLMIGRLYAYAALPIIFLMLPLITFWMQKPTLHHSYILRIITIIFISMAPIVGVLSLEQIAKVFTASPKDESDTCDANVRSFLQQDAMKYLPEPALIFTATNDMPPLIFWTPHRALAGNYHREPRAIEASSTFFSTPSEDKAWALVQHYQPRALIVCTKREHKGAFIWDIIHNKRPLPSWLQPVIIDNKRHPNVRVYEIKK